MFVRDGSDFPFPGTPGGRYGMHASWKHPSSDLALSGEATFSHKGRRLEPGLAVSANRRRLRLAKTLPQPSLLPLWEKVAAPTGLAFGKPEDRLRAVG
ncbi:hypothetical protein MesoLjLb_36380 [Mesorhizobium sp. L-8-3]|nr:hypothetical protein MesoLjLb_36380 [Mesorhizobium sp. L-8-3]